MVNPTVKSFMEIGILSKRLTFPQVTLASLLKIPAIIFTSFQKGRFSEDFQLDTKSWYTIRRSYRSHKLRSAVDRTRLNGCMPSLCWIDIYLECWKLRESTRQTSWNLYSNAGAEQRTWRAEAQDLTSRPHRKLLWWPGQEKTAGVCITSDV